MAYSPTNWKNGDTVTAEKLNKLEEGVANAGAVLVVPLDISVDGTTVTSTKTAGELFTAAQNGSLVVFQAQMPDFIAYFTTSDIVTDGGYYFNLSSSALPQLRAATADDYPSSGNI